MALPTNTGAFIHNGVNCTPNTIQTAQGVPYDNTSSGLSATNVQGAVDEVCNKLPTKQNATWIKLGDTTGTTEIDAPANWNEMIVYGEFGGNSNYGFSTYVIYTQSSGFPRRFIEGCGVTNDFHQAIWHLENYKIGLDKWQYNSTDYTSASKLHIYYR